MPAKTYLINRPKPYPYEALESYIKRLGKTNYYEEVQWIFSLLNLKGNFNFNYIVRNDKKLVTLSDLTLLDSEVLFSMTSYGMLEHSGLRIQDKLNHQSSKKDLVNQYLVSTSRFCPECLRNHNATFLYFLIRYITVCPEHDVRLIDRCPICQTKINLNYEKCLKCNTPLINMGSNRISENIKLLNNHLLSVFVSSNSEPLNCSFETENNPFLNLDPKDFLLLVGNLSKVTLRLQHFITLQEKKDWETNNFKGKGIVNLEVKDLHQILNIVSRIIFEYPICWFDLLDQASKIETIFRRIFVDSNRTYSQSPGQYFGLLFNNEIWSELWASIHQFLGKNINEHKDLFRTWKFYLNKFSNNNGSLPYVSVGNCAENLKLAPVTIKKMIIGGEVEAVGLSDEKYKNQGIFIISKENFEKAKILIEAQLSLKEVSLLLGIGRYKLNFLIKDRLISVENLSTKTPLVYKENVVRFLEEYFYSIPVRQPPSNEKVLSIERVISSLGQFHLNFASIFNEIKEKKIIAFRKPDQFTLQCIWVEKEQFESYQFENFTLMEEFCSVKTICRVLHCERTTVLALIRMGLLTDVSTEKTKKDSCSVKVAQVLEFKEKYFRIDEASRILQITPNTVRKWVNNGKLPSNTYFIVTNSVVFFDKQLLTESFPPRDEICSLTSVCDALKCRQETAMALINQGYLTNLSNRIKLGEIWAISINQLEQFQREYIRIRAASLILQVQKQTIRDWMKNRKLPPTLYILVTENIVYFKKQLLIDWSTKNS